MNIEEIPGGQFEPSAHLSTIQRVLVAGEHGRGTPGERALAAVVLCRRDLRDLVAQVAAADATAALLREELAARDAKAKVAQLNAAHAAEIAELNDRHTSKLVDLKTFYDALMKDLECALGQLGQDIEAMKQ